VDSTAETINVGNLAGLSDGDAVKYFNGGGTNVGGLVDGRVYFANVDDGDPNAIKVKLFNSRSDAIAGTNGVDLDASVATGTTHRIVKVVDAYHERTISVDPVAAVDDTNNRLNVVNGTLANGDSIIYRTQGAAIGGLTNGNTYFVRIVKDDNGAPIGIQLFNNRGDADGNTNAIDLAPAASANAAPR